MIAKVMVDIRNQNFLLKYFSCNFSVPSSLKDILAASINVIKGWLGVPNPEL